MPIPASAPVESPPGVGVGVDVGEGLGLDVEDGPGAVTPAAVCGGELDIDVAVELELLLVSDISRITSKSVDAHWIWMISAYTVFALTSSGDIVVSCASAGIGPSTLVSVTYTFVKGDPKRLAHAFWRNPTSVEE